LGREGFFLLTFQKIVKYLLVTLACLIIFISFLENRLGPVAAYTPPEEPYFTLHAVLSPYFWGIYGGYWDIWFALQPEFAKIGIDLQLHFSTDIYLPWELLWSPGVPEGGQPGGSPPKGWDTIMQEWRLQPQGMLWMDKIILSKNLINGPESGLNTFPYLNRESDSFYWMMQTSFDVAARKAYADAWQAELMHNPPIINIYYPHIYHVRGRYIEGYDPTVWWYDTSHLRLNLTRVQEMYDAGNLSAINYDRLYNQKTIVYDAEEAWWSYLVTYVDSRTEELYQNLVSGTLYKSSLDPWPVEGEASPSQDYTVKPWLASSLPQDIGWETDWDSNQVYRVRIPLRTGVLWSDSHPFDAEDVVWTINENILNPSLGCTATCDFAPIVKRAEYIGNFTPGSPGHNATALDLILYEPYVDLPLVLANTWGGGVLPHHYFGGVPPPWEIGENRVFCFVKIVPSIGPYKFLEEGIPPGYSYITLERNDLYFGYNTSIVGSPAWGPYDIDKIKLEYVPYSEDRLLNIQLHDAEFGDPQAVQQSPFEVFREFMIDPTLLGYIVPHMASNGVWMNFNNPNLSNRYVRLAIAHAIPYENIFTDILPSWGIVNPIAGGSFIHPWQYYGGVQLWNSEMPLYTYNLTIAQQYLDMWLYAQTGTNHTKGCVGDANFDGIVDLDDLWYWMEEYGNAPYTRQITWLDPDWYTTYPWPIDGGTVAPGNDIDADFNNNGIVGPEDYGLWLANVGKEYPFSGAW
jgi:ABC-type transport system substrate-binding protein